MLVFCLTQLMPYLDGLFLFFFASVVLQIILMEFVQIKKLELREQLSTCGALGVQNLHFPDM